MSLLESLNLEHLPSSHTIYIALFRNVKNAAFLHQQLLAGNTDFEYAFIDASVVSPPLMLPLANPSKILQNHVIENIHSQFTDCITPSCPLSSLSGRQRPIRE